MHATCDDVAQLLAEPPDNTNVAGEDKLLTELVASQQDEDTEGQKVQQQLVVSVASKGALNHNLTK